MNNRYLYRAKRTDNGEFIEGLLTIMWGQFHIINPDDENTAYPIYESTICQCTGLKDKNGNLIWENDIIKYHFGDVYAPIRYGEYKSCFDSTSTGHIGFYVDWRGTKKENMRKDLGYWINMISAEVEGNIFDNPELLEVG